MPGYNLLNARLHITQILEQPNGQDIIEEVAEDVAARDDTPASAVPDVIGYCINQYAEGQRLGLLADTHHIDYDVLGKAIEEVVARATEEAHDAGEEDA